MATLVVAYPKSEGATFDRAYYMHTHMKLVADAWTEHRLMGFEILFPSDETQAFATVAVLRFAGQASIDAALGSDRTAEVMADIAKFTNITPLLHRVGD